MKSLVFVGAAAAALGALAALSAAGPSAAQAVTNSKAPIDIVGDSLETSNSTCQAVYRGSAEALQDKARLRADVIKIFARQTPAKSGSNSPGCGDMQRIEAEGNVYYVTPQQRVRANHALYEAGSTTITMTGDVVAVQGQNVLRGDKMVFNTETGQGHVEGTAKGRGAKDRPRGVFYPESSASTSDKPK